jgi:hypothetical protein
MSISSRQAGNFVLAQSATDKIRSWGIFISPAAFLKNSKHPQFQASSSTTAKMGKGKSLL